jgi:hypothetical protein
MKRIGRDGIPFVRRNDRPLDNVPHAKRRILNLADFMVNGMLP